MAKKKNVIVAKLIEDAKLLGVAFLLSLVVMQIAFFRTSPLAIIGFCLSLFYLYVLPLYPLTYLFFSKESFWLRLLFGLVFSLAVVNVLSYYLTLLGLPIGVHHYFLPVVLFLVSAAIFYLRRPHLLHELKPSVHKKS